VCCKYARVRVCTRVCMCVYVHVINLCMCILACSFTSLCVRVFVCMSMFLYVIELLLDRE
jgi:hypothetical protein